MPCTDASLLEQLHITEPELELRKRLFHLTEEDIERLRNARSLVEPHVGRIIEELYAEITDHPEASLLIGDSESLARLQRAMYRYVTELFSGLYDLDYVQTRLRIGLVHKRIGVEPKLYLAAQHFLQNLLCELLQEVVVDPDAGVAVCRSLRHLLQFDTTLVFDTYIRSLVSEIETAHSRVEQYARDLEAKIRERTSELEELSRTDPMTGLRNVRHLDETLTRTLRAAERRGEPVTLGYLDLDGFKEINDRHGHLRGDEVLRNFARVLVRAVRAEDTCFRYGGDEFCVVLPNCRAEDAAEILGPRLVEALGPGPPRLGFSLGLAETGPPTYASPGRLIEIADQRMLERKHGPPHSIHTPSTPPSPDPSQGSC